MQLAGRSFRNRNNDALMSDINVTPLVDIMLVLLIVFIITAPVMHQAFRLNLPKESAQKLDLDEKFITIEIASNGAMSLDGVAMTEDALLDNLKTIRRNQGQDARIHLKADQATQYANIARLLALANQAGLSRISFVTRPSQEPPEKSPE